MRGFAVAGRADQRQRGVLVFGVPASPTRPALGGGRQQHRVTGAGGDRLRQALRWRALGLGARRRAGHRRDVCAALPASAGGAGALLVVLSGATRTASAHGRAGPTRRGAGAAASPMPTSTPFSRYNRVLDVSRDDMHSLLEQAQLQACRRRLGACAAPT